MIVICEECGKKYTVNVDKMTKDVANYKCPVCNHIITVRKPTPPAPEPPSPEPISPEAPSPESASPEPEGPKEEVKEMAPVVGGSQRTGLGLRGRMMVLFVVVPVVLLIAGGLFYLNQTRRLSNLITEESSKMVVKMAETIIAEKARAVAQQVKLYLDTHPDLKKEDFNKDPKFKEVAIQKVGETGYTCVVAIKKETEPSCLWAHPTDKLIGVDIVKAMEKALGKEYERWFKIQDIAFKTGKESGGYYLWQDNREKFMVMTPVQGTDFFVSSTTYMDEFTSPVMKLKENAGLVTSSTLRIAIMIQAITILVIGIIAFVYGNRVSGKIRYLTQVADRISVGQLGEEITLKSQDEIGALAEAISRLQDSVRISVERLRRRSR